MESEDSEERKNRKRRKMEKKLAKRNARATAAAASTAAIGEVCTVSSMNKTTDDCNKGSVTEPMDEGTSEEGVGQRQELELELEQGQNHVDSAPTAKATAGLNNSPPPPPSEVPAAAYQHYDNEVIDLCDSEEDDDDDDVIHIDDEDNDEDSDVDGLIDSGNKVNKNNKSTNGKGAGDSEGDLEADILDNFNSASKKNATEEHRNFFGIFRPSPAVNSSEKNSIDPKKGKAAGRSKRTVAKSNVVKKLPFEQFGSTEETIAADRLDKEKQRAAKAYKHFTDENGKISC
jgi:hypothetical protein